MPNFGEGLVGGHAVIAVGYDQTNRRFLVRNSWGEDWGIRGNFWMLFNNRERFFRYLKCILIGVPAWYVIGVLVTFSDQFGLAFGIPDVDPGTAIMYQY